MLGVLNIFLLYLLARNDSFMLNGWSFSSPFSQLQKYEGGGGCRGMLHFRFSQCDCEELYLLECNVCCLLISFFTYSLTPKMVAMSSSETSVDFHQATWHCIPENRTFKLFKYMSFISDVLQKCEIIQIKICNQI
jgi:hypothetical protein